MLRVVFVTVLISALSEKLTTNLQTESPRMRDPNGSWKLVNQRKSRIHVRSFSSGVPTLARLSMVL